MRPVQEDIAIEKLFRKLAEELHAKFDVRINIISRIGIFYECDDKLALFYIDKYLCNHNYYAHTPWLNTTTSSDVSWEIPMSPPVSYWLRPQNIQVGEFINDADIISVEKLKEAVDYAIECFEDIDDVDTEITKNGGWSLSDDTSEFDLLKRGEDGFMKLSVLGYVFRPKKCILVDTNTCNVAHNVFICKLQNPFDEANYFKLAGLLNASSSKEELELKCAASSISLPVADFKLLCFTLSGKDCEDEDMFAKAVSIGLFDDLFSSKSFIEDAIKFFTNEKGEVASQLLYYVVGVREKQCREIEKLKSSQM